MPEYTFLKSYVGFKEGEVSTLDGLSPEEIKELTDDGMIALVEPKAPSKRSKKVFSAAPTGRFELYEVLKLCKGENTPKKYAVSLMICNPEGEVIDTMDAGFVGDPQPIEKIKVTSSDGSPHLGSEHPGTLDPRGMMQRKVTDYNRHIGK